MQCDVKCFDCDYQRCIHEFPVLPVNELEYGLFHSIVRLSKVYARLRGITLKKRSGWIHHQPIVNSVHLLGLRFTLPRLHRSALSAIILKNCLPKMSLLKPLTYLIIKKKKVRKI